MHMLPRIVYIVERCLRGVILGGQLDYRHACSAALAGAFNYAGFHGAPIQRQIDIQNKPGFKFGFKLR